jgi:GNAT superfamily N-acetyltransferase
MDIYAVTKYDNPSFPLKENIARFISMNSSNGHSDFDFAWKAVDYALSLNGNQGGFILMARDEGELKGVLVINRTGHEFYLPENLLVYLVTTPESDKKDIAAKLLQKATQLAKGNIAVHLDKNNPDTTLFELLGFREKCVEYQLVR